MVKLQPSKLISRVRFPHPAPNNERRNMGRTLTEDELKEVEETIKEALDDPEGVLSEWETEFVNSTADRLGKYEDRTSFSDKQLEILAKIRKKLKL